MSYNIFQKIPPHVRIMLVTKGRNPETIENVLQRTGLRLIGENRIQEAQHKFPLLTRSNVEKHFIGHLQTNKAEQAVQLFDAIESIDSQKLAVAVSAAATTLRKVIPIFLQVNISHDPSKFGFDPATLKQMLQDISPLPFLQVVGLMTITARQDKSRTRLDFQRMRQLQQQLQLSELSMGMSADWSMAVSEGATIIRLGRYFFS